MRFVPLGVLLVGSVVLGGCVDFPGGDVSLSDSGGMSVVVQDGAPFPASVEFVDEILAIEPATPLPAGAKVVDVWAASNFAKNFPTGWGYIIAFEAEPNNIIDYFETQTDFSMNILYTDPTANSDRDYFADIYADDIVDPALFYITSHAQVILERPLGRGWLLIRHAAR